MHSASTRTHWNAFVLPLAFAVSAASAQLSPIVVSPQVRVSPHGAEWWSATIRLDTSAPEGERVHVSAMTVGGLVEARGVWPFAGGWVIADRSPPHTAAPGAGLELRNVPTFVRFRGARALALGTVTVGHGRTVLVNGGSYAGTDINSGLPYAIYTDDGADWKPDPGVAMPTPLLLGNSAIEAAASGPASGAADTPWQVDRRNHAPSVAARYVEGDNDEVYVAFCARAARGSANTDIYVSRSTGAETNAIEFSPPSFMTFLHLSDTFLGTPTGTDGADQFVPAIAVDSCGGVNLMFYDNRHDPDRTDSIELVDVYYARIANFGTGTEWVFQQRLTPQSIRVDNLGGTRFLGDYHNLTVSADGRTIYAAYISRDNADPVNGDRTCYVHRIDISCIGPLAEMTGDGTVTGEDAAAFTSAWAAGEAAADTNLDMVVNADDLVDYLLTYAEEAE